MTMTFERTAPTTASAPALAAWPFLAAAAMDVLLGLDLLFLAGPIMELALVAPIDPIWLQAAGVALAVYGVDMAIVARSRGALRRFRPVFLIANWIYVPLALGAALVFADLLTGIGTAMLLATVVATGVLAFFQQRAQNPD